MITVRRGTARHHEHGRKLDTWQTFGSGQTPGVGEGFSGLERLDEIHLGPSARSSLQAPPGVDLLTYVQLGSVACDDARGQAGVLQAGEFQLMSAEHCIRHTITNASRVDPALAFEMWLKSAANGLERAPECKRFSAAERRGGLCVIASPEGRRGSLHLRQDTLVYAAMMERGQHVVLELHGGRSAWLHVVAGELRLEDAVLSTGDGAGATAERAVSFTAHRDSEVLLIELDAGLPPGSS